MHACKRCLLSVLGGPGSILHCPMAFQQLSGPPSRVTNAGDARRPRPPTPPSPLWWWWGWGGGGGGRSCSVQFGVRTASARQTKASSIIRQGFGFHYALIEMNTSEQRAGTESEGNQDIRLRLSQGWLGFSSLVQQRTIERETQYPVMRLTGGWRRQRVWWMTWRRRWPSWTSSCATCGTTSPPSRRATTAWSCTPATAPSCWAPWTVRRPRTDVAPANTAAAS